MGATYLGFETKTANGAITVLEDCNFIVAFVTGSELPPWINGIEMQTISTVPAQGVNAAISFHVLPVVLEEILPFIMFGTSVTFIFIQNGVCARSDTVSGYSAAGEVSGTLITSTDDLLLGMVLGNNGQVAETADTVALTAIVDTLTTRIGYQTPGDSSQEISATDPGTLSGYWYTPPPVWHDTTTTVLVSAGYWKTTAVYHKRYMKYTYFSGSFYHYDLRQYNAPGDSNYTIGDYLLETDHYLTGTYIGSESITTTWYSYPQTWVPPVYETQQSGYWTYSNPVWVETGVAGYVSAIIASVADVMIGGIYVSRPLIA